MQDRKSAKSTKTSCDARPDHTKGVIRVGSVTSAAGPIGGSFRKWRFGVDGFGVDVIQAPLPEFRIMRYELSDSSGLPSGRCARISRVSAPSAAARGRGKGVCGASSARALLQTKAIPVRA